MSDMDVHHDYMIEAVETEAARLGRNLKWEEALQIADAYLTLHSIPHEDWFSHDWVQCTDLPVSSFQVEGTVGVAWGCFETEQDAEEAVQTYQSSSGRTFSYKITFCE